jgi:hypothetical protein
MKKPPPPKKKGKMPEKMAEKIKGKEAEGEEMMKHVKKAKKDAGRKPRNKGRA